MNIIKYSTKRRRRTYTVFPFLSFSEEKEDCDPAVLLEVDEEKGSLPLLSDASAIILDIGLVCIAGVLPQIGFDEETELDSVAAESSCCAKRLLSFCEIFLGIGDYKSGFVSIVVYSKTHQSSSLLSGSLQTHRSVGFLFQ